MFCGYTVLFIVVAIAAMLRGIVITPLLIGVMTWLVAREHFEGAITKAEKEVQISSGGKSGCISLCINLVSRYLVLLLLFVLLFFDDNTLQFWLCIMP